jgi:hypothetical protein
LIQFRWRSVLFILTNILFSLFLPKIKNKHNDSFDIVHFEKKYLYEIEKIYSSELGNGNLLSRSIKIILFLCGNKTAFVILNSNNSVIGYAFYYFNFNDLKKLYIHAASAAVLPDYRQSIYGGSLYFYAFDWFKYNTWIRGISARYRVSNRPVKRLHDYLGYKVITRYFKDEEEWVYVICDFNKGWK